MPWVRLDDAILDNVKILNVGPLGLALHIAGITYSARNLTDGFVPFSKAATLIDFSGVQCDSVNPACLPAHGRKQSMCGSVVVVDDVIQALINEDLWDVDTARGGYVIHDYLDYNPSKADVLAERAKKSEAGKRGAKTRWKPENDGASHSTSHGTCSANGVADRVANGWQNDAPVPVPVPLSDQHQKQSHALSCLQGGARR